MDYSRARAKKIKSLWDASLETFQGSIAHPEPMPAGVSVSAVTAALGTGLLQKVLAIAAKKSRPSGDYPHPETAEFSSLRRAAAREAERLKQFADADIAAYNAYREARQRTKGHADLPHLQHEVIQVPLKSAQSALASLELCAGAAPLIQGPVLADLASAAILLCGAIRAMLLCLGANLDKTPDPAVTGLSRQIESRAATSLDTVMQFCNPDLVRKPAK